MKRPDDETLMAYADGQLDPSEMARITEYLRHDAEARETVAMFQGTSAIIAGFGDEAFSKPVSPELIAMLRTGGTASDTPKPPEETVPDHTLPSSRTAEVIPFRPKRGAIWTGSARDLAALAACLVLIAGGTMTWLARPNGGAGDTNVTLAVGPISANSPLAQVLEQRPSHQPVALASRGGEPTALVAMSTFQDQAERYCREFELTSGAEQRPLSIGVACRTSGGIWTVEGVVKTDGGQVQTPGVVKPAGSNQTAALDGLMSKLGARPALTKDNERAIIGRGWK